ncbi:hypothetical protein B0A50_05635 [Salinomyces thailandicus]|uniref:Small ribosomal subunit protein mS29 n=1 Tax=Salinomyces thailandicus TaxID=706561 RepID=A0A4U0TUC5_9PEZI|nr:hypothetical protein B0A50_05635 [Salinomyces thailandica]
MRRALGPIDAATPFNAAPSASAAFSTSAALSANPPKKKGVVAKPAARTGRTLRLSKNTRTATARPPAPGERRALRKRVVLSNTNALEVRGLADLSTQNASRLREMGFEGQVLGLSNDSVDALRALEAFKATQGWSLFRRPASLIRRETVELAECMDGVAQQKHVERRMLFGERGGGKSVLQLQAMAMAYLRGWIVVHFPEAKAMTIAHEAYRPINSKDGSTAYIQPQYTARLLGNIAKANHGVLTHMRLSKPPELPVPVQSNISLLRFVELGAGDAELAWPVWRALLSELTTPSQEGTEGLQRPPLFLSMDGVDHAMRHSAYLDTAARPIHAHDLTLIRDFAAHLSGTSPLPNGGMVLAASSASTRPSTPTLDHVLARNEAAAYSPTYTTLLSNLHAHISALATAKDVDLSALHTLPSTPSTQIPATLLTQLKHLRTHLTSLARQNRSPADLLAALAAHAPKLPEWNPYLPLDSRVADCMASVTVQKVAGLSKAEARGMLEYYAQSGVLRQTVTEGLVGERWTISGGGVVGELEKAAVKARF